MGFRGMRRGYYSPRFRGRGRGGRGGYQAGGTSLDRRPSKIVVSGYEVEERDEVLEQFQKFGEIVETVDDENIPSMTIQFKTRREAEMASNSGKSFNERLLSISW